MVRHAAALVEKQEQQGSIISAGLSDVIVQGNDGKEYSGDKGFARHNGWLQTSALVVADVVGTGVLGIGGGFAQFGWLVGTILFIVFAPINYLTGWQLNKIHLEHPGSKTLGDAARAIWGNGLVGYIGLPMYLFFVMCSYMQVLGATVQQLIYQQDMCLGTGTMIACFVMLPFVQLRTLHNLALLSAISFATIFLTILICLVMLVKNDVECAKDTVPDPYSGIENAFSAFSKFIFAFAGQTIFLEMNAEMKEPKHFPRSLNLAYAVMLSLYYLVSATTFAHCGDNTPTDKLTTLVEPGPWLNIVGALMLIHMVISYNISSTVLIRTLFVNTGFTLGVEHSIKGRFAWFVLATSTLGLCALCANLIPGFGNIVNFVSDVGICPLCFILPSALFLSMDSKRAAAHPEKAGIVMKSVCWFVIVLFSVQMCLGGYFDVMAIISDEDSLSCNRQHFKK